jgi:universal stress protein E
MNMIYGFRSILVATDFSTHSEAAMKQAIWLSRNSGARVVLAHVLPDLRLAIPDPFSVQQFDPLQGEEERFRSDIIEETEARLRLLIDQVGAKDLGVQYQVLSGDPSIALIQAVQQEKFDLVLVGMRGLAPWERFTMGCTSKRLVRKCPSPVWTIHADRAIPPKVVLAATDFSEVSRSAALQGRRIASEAGAEFHLLHVVDSNGFSSVLTKRSELTDKPVGQIYDAAAKQFEEFVRTLESNSDQIHCHQSVGDPAREILHFAELLNADLVTLGTVGKSGAKGVYLGKTAERFLEVCPCSVLTMKPEGFISPIGMSPAKEKLETTIA